MRALRNPYIVAALAIVALALVAYQVWPKTRSRPGAPRPVATAPKQAAATVPATLQEITSVGTPAEQPANLPIDADLIESRAEDWLTAPRRDPFKSRFGTQGSSASQLLTLGAVWLQDGASVAVINRRVVRVGDAVLQFTLRKIEKNGVWVDGPNCREFVGFRLGPIDSDRRASAKAPATTSVAGSTHSLTSSEP